MRLPLPIDRVFAFFADAGNLEAITPPLLRFRILTPRPIEMRPGTLIDYRLSLRGVPVRWRTEICEFDPPHRFTDRQLRGPYRRWEHAHTFAPDPETGGTIVADRVVYELPRVPGRSLVHALIVRPELRRIFEFRHAAITRLLTRAPLTARTPSADDATPAPAPGRAR
ncbi:MAG TPA: CDP-paratose 2-epimerase [Phycisphaerales bacterium]|nr:CDP-paratose 2-epimerase [Phycisphaerales bacterium]